MTQKVIPIAIKLKIANFPSPFCQMIGKNISVQSCLEAQGQEGCFGCAASTRLCESCQENLVDVPAFGQCSHCLTFGLNEEAAGRTAPVGLVQVDCQVLKKSIRGEMCHATQGQEGCRNCPAASRLCEKCKQYPCRFPLYGLCIRCGVEEYGDGWQPLSEVVVSEEVQSKIRHTWQISVPAEEEEEKAGPDRQEKIALAELLISRAAEFIRSKGHISQDMLATEFQIDEETATHLLDFLLEEGIIDTKERRQATQKGINFDRLTIRDKIGRLEELIKVIGTNAEFSDLLKSVITDLQQWDNFKRILKKDQQQ